MGFLVIDTGKFSQYSQLTDIQRANLAHRDCVTTKIHRNTADRIRVHQTDNSSNVIHRTDSLSGNCQFIQTNIVCGFLASFAIINLPNQEDQSLEQGLMLHRLRLQLLEGKLKTKQ